MTKASNIHLANNLPPLMRMAKQLPYWLTGGTEVCAVCEHHYVLEMEYRCVACDRGVCGQCGILIRETHLVFCYDCDPEREE